MTDPPRGSAAGRSAIEAWLAGFVREPGFLVAYPYYAAILAKLAPVADPSVERMAVSFYEGRFYLHVNVESFLSEPQFLRGVLLHEVHHVVLGHLTHPKFAEVEHRDLMELALEMSANEYIEEPLPPAVTCRAYAAVGIRGGQSTLERYELFARWVRAKGTPVPHAPGERGTGTVDDHRFLARAGATPGGATQAALLVSQAVAAEQAAQQASPAPTPPEASREAPRRFLVAGRTPARLVEELTDTLRAPDEPLDYAAALAMFAARARAPVHTWSRPSRRFPERIFAVPGRTWAPRTTERPRLLVAIDTSLSMTRVELEEIARHLVSLAERAHLTIAECDVEISRLYPFAGRLDQVVGRGGTDLRPVFAPAFLGSLGVDGVVYFTDGLGPTPAESPPIPTLWILTKPHDFACPWGERARFRRAAR